MSAERKLMGTTDATTAANYVEDVFSTYLYTGTGASQTITTGVNLSTYGGLVWMKGRSGATETSDHALYDTARGVTLDLVSNSTAAQTTQATGLTAFGSTGFSIGALAKINTNAATYASWTFREQAKFFDVVTYTGNATNPRTIAHNLGSTPGLIIVKRTDTLGDWWTYHRSTGAGAYLKLNTTDASVTSASFWGTGPTSTNFIVNAGALNASGGTYVAYIYAHDAGGFGASGTDNVISCGSFTTDAFGASSLVNLGYEPQWIMFKRSNASTGGGQDNWQIVDSMRGLNSGTTVPNEPVLFPNNSDAEYAWPLISVSAQGFQTTNQGYLAPSSTFIYMAIRRGPMRTPTSGTSVLSVKTYSATTTSASVTHDNVFDLEINKNRAASSPYLWVDRLRSLNGVALQSSGASAETSYPTYWSARNQTEMYAPSAFDAWWASGAGVQSHSSNAFSRAPGFFDVVCYTGTGANTTQTHNLAAVPELMIVKGRSAATAWQVYSSALANTEYLVLSTTAAKATGATRWNSTTPTSSVFSLGTAAEVNTSSATYVAYLFASVPGVSKVGSYTGTGAAQTINCGFTAGARFVLIKRTDGTGDWYIYDTARGMVTGTDPYLLMNTTAAEVNANYVFTSSTGFTIQAAAPAGINGLGGTFIYLAIA